MYYANIFHCKTLQNLPKSGFCLKISILATLEMKLCTYVGRSNNDTSKKMRPDSLGNWPNWIIKFSDRWNNVLGFNGKGRVWRDKMSNVYVMNELLGFVKEM
jgi:hypothetical protein